MLQIITPPTIPICTLSELKCHLVIEHSEEDTRLNTLLNTCCDVVERDSGLKIRSQVWRQVQKCFSTAVDIEALPVRSVVVKYYDDNNVLQTLDSSDYYLMNSTNLAAKIYPVESFPNIYSRPDAVQIDVTCGYQTIPPAAKQAVLLLAGGWNENREAEISGTITTELKLGYQRLIDLLRNRPYL